MKRVVVIGTTGAGKSTLAARLAARLGCPHIELDALFWGPNWKPVETVLFRERVENATGQDCWVADGNYTGKALDIVWNRADTVVWLDYALPVIMGRLVVRTVRRAAQGELLWGTNREHLRDHLFTRDSLFLWALRTHGKHRREFPGLFAKPEHKHLQVIRLCSSRETERWLANIQVGDCARPAGGAGSGLAHSE